jgi:hypothetical protein
MNSIPRREARAMPSFSRLLDDPEGSSVDSVGAETPISRPAWQLSKPVACSCRTSASRDHRQDLGMQPLQEDRKRPRTQENMNRFPNDGHFSMTVERRVGQSSQMIFGGQ